MPSSVENLKKRYPNYSVHHGTSPVVLVNWPAPQTCCLCKELSKTSFPLWAFDFIVISPNSFLSTVEPLAFCCQLNSLICVCLCMWMQCPGRLQISPELRLEADKCCLVWVLGIAHQSVHCKSWTRLHLQSHLSSPHHLNFNRNVFTW